MAYYYAYGDSDDGNSSDSDTRYRLYQRSFPEVLSELDRSIFEKIYYRCSMSQEHQHHEPMDKPVDSVAPKMVEEQRKRREKEAQEKADKKAAELIEIEEMQRRKREKNIRKHQKKKAKKQAKKQAQTGSTVFESTQAQNDYCETVENKENGTCLEGELDPSSAFAVKSMQKSNLNMSSVSTVGQKPMEKFQELRQLASSLMQQDFLSEACSVLNKAIATAPKEIEIYLERAKCFYKLEQYDKALQDAKVVIECIPRSTQAYVVVSKAYASLMQFDKAEEALTTAKDIIGCTQEIQTEMEHLGILKLVELGFEETVAAAAMERKLNFQDALDELTWDVEKLALAGNHNEENGGNASEDGENAAGYTLSCDGAVSSGDQDSSVPEPSRSLWVGSVSHSATWDDLYKLFGAYGEIESIYKPPMATFAFVNFTSIAKASDALYALNNHMLYDGRLVIRYAKPNARFVEKSKLVALATSKKIDPRNPLGIRSIYVANVMSRTTEKELISLFSTCGHVTSCQILRDKKCAFVNYSTSAEATRALETLQNFRHRNVSLVLKFPNNTHNIVIGKNTEAVRSSTGPVAQGSSASGECMFWRKGECVFEDKCWQLHIPEHKGIDA